MTYEELFIDKDDVLLIRKELVRVLGDLNEAVVLNQLHYWININKKAKKNEYDDKYWVFNTYQMWKDTDFDFWSTDTIKRTFSRLEKKGVVISANYNKMKMDKTKWYSIDYDKLQDMIDEYVKEQNATINNADCVQDRAKCTDGEGDLHKAIPEITTENTDRDYNADNKYAFSEDKSSSKVGNIYAFSPEEKEVRATQKQSRFIPADYSYEQLRKHIRPVYESVLKDVYGCTADDTPIEDILDITDGFYRLYEQEMGTKHRVLSDRAYANLVDAFMNPPDIMSEEYMFDYEAHMDMAKLYFTTDYNKQKKFKGTIEKSLSHFMTDMVRYNLFYRACYYEKE